MQDSELCQLQLWYRLILFHFEHVDQFRSFFGKLLLCSTYEGFWKSAGPGSGHVVWFCSVARQAQQMNRRAWGFSAWVWIRSESAWARSRSNIKGNNVIHPLTEVEHLTQSRKRSARRALRHSLMCSPLQHHDLVSCNYLSPLPYTFPFFARLIIRS